jgi:hypothetical protein
MFDKLPSMNPSRITTPLDKQIDEWWFKYMDRPLKWRVFLHRTRDIERENHGKFESHFYAVPDPKSLKKLELDTFPTERIEAPTFEELRAKVTALINSWLNATWEKVIVVFLEESRAWPNLDNTRMINDHNVVKFDFVVCHRSRDGQFWKKPENTYVSRRIGDMICTTGETGSFQALVYSEELLASLNGLSEKLKVLACGLRELVFKRPEDFIRWFSGPIQLLPTATVAFTAPPVSTPAST